MISKTIGYNGVHDIFRHTHHIREHPFRVPFQQKLMDGISSLHGWFGMILQDAWHVGQVQTLHTATVACHVLEPIPHTYTRIQEERGAYDRSV